MVKNLEELCSHSVRAALLFEKCRPEVLHHIPTQLKFARLIQAVVAGFNVTLFIKSILMINVILLVILSNVELTRKSFYFTNNFSW